MAVEIINQTIGGDLGSALGSAFSSIPGMSTILQISKAVGIVIIIYLIVLIFRALIQARQALRLKNLAKNVEDINKKMDILIGKKSRK